MTVTNENEVVCIEHASSSGLLVGVIMLNAPHRINALNLTMAKKILDTLQRWKEDSRVVAVVFVGSGSTGFCSGGDLRHMLGMLDSGDAVTARNHMLEFFTTEYRLNYLVHHYPKPTIAIGHGILMGGGAALFMAARHRIVTDTVRFAFPEVAIGFFPDVGASRILANLPGQSGLYLGLTGHRCNASDCVALGLAHLAVPSMARDRLVGDILLMNWTGTASDEAGLMQLLPQRTSADMNSHQSEMAARLASLNRICAAGSARALLDELKTCSQSDSFYARDATALQEGSPLAAAYTQELWRIGKTASMNEMFECEFATALKFMSNGEFSKGVRARLIDRKPAGPWLLDWNCFDEAVGMARETLAPYRQAPALMI